MTDSEDDQSGESSDDDHPDQLLPILQEQIIPILAERLSLTDYDVRSQLIEDEKLWVVIHDLGFTLIETEQIMTEVIQEALVQISQELIVDPNHLFQLKKDLHHELFVDLEHV